MNHLKEYQEFVNKNKDVIYRMEEISLPQMIETHKYVGAQIFGGKLYAIPNDARRILKYEKHKVEFIGDLAEGLFKWTGGYIRNRILYIFPRSAGVMLTLDLEKEIISMTAACRTYHGEHHYGGCMTPDGKIYQPPRSTDHILAWDLNQGSSYTISMPKECTDKKENCRYCGSIYHPDGYIYFLPERNLPVLKLDVRTEKIEIIGRELEQAFVFDAKIAVDGLIYGYSAYGGGILRIDPIQDCVEMIYEDTHFWCYGTKAGINGHLYGIPGDGGHVWDYDPLSGKLEWFAQAEGDLQAKYAGGATTPNGKIYGVPARQNKIFCLIPDRRADIPNEIYEAFFADCY